MMPAAERLPWRIFRRRSPSIRKRKETLEGHRQTLDDTGEAQLSLTDPDSRSMHSGTRVGVGYNVQIAVDTEHNLIAEPAGP